ncbi:mitochondrial carrier domain-containing protein [Phlyctochytrium arcticum]|nr:mitochondrial carrier domain-containing protein [Phlyctochytrium arcticum]
MTDREEVLRRFNPYASAAATLQAGDGTDLALPAWSPESFEEQDFEGYSSQDFAVYAIVQFLAKGLANPFDVATILQQTQFAPSDAFLARYSGHLVETGDDDCDNSDTQPEEADSDSDTGESNPYFTRNEEPEDRAYVPSVNENAAADGSGYLLKASHLNDESTRPPFQLPTLESSTLGAISDIVSMRDEGFTSLWKGQVPSWLFGTSHSFLQPSLEKSIIELSHEHDIMLSGHTDSVNTIGIKVLSHALSSFFLSPLDLIRTRLVVQTSNRYHRKYNGTLHCLRTILAEEGWRAMYFGRHFVPTLLLQTFRPFFHFTGSILLERMLHLDADTSPFLWALGDLGLKAVELLVTIPLETVRRRLQCQIVTRMPVEKPLESSVERNPIPYTGLIDCAGRVIIEEGGTRTVTGKRRSRKGRPKQPTWWNSWGFHGLYRGFKIKMVSAVMLMVVNSLADLLDVPDESL